MKKIIIIIIVLLLVAGAALFIVNMNKNHSELLELVDKYAGYKSTMEYDKNSEMLVEEIAETNRAEKKITDENIEMTISYISGNDKNQMSTDKNNGLEITELDIEGTSGYKAFDPDYNEGKVLIRINNDYQNNPQGVMCFEMKIEDKENEEGTSVKTYMDNEEFMKMIKSFKFEMIDKEIKEGVLCFDYSYGIKAPNVDGYSLKYSILNTKQTEAYLNDKDENTVLSVSVKPIVTADNLEDYVDSQKTYSIYTGEIVDKTIGNYSIKFLPLKSEDGTSGKTRNYGYTEINGVIYMVDISLKDFEEAKANDFTAKILDSIYEIKK